MGRAMGPLKSVYSSQTWLIIRMTLKIIKVFPLGSFPVKDTCLRCRLDLH